MGKISTGDLQIFRPTTYKFSSTDFFTGYKCLLILAYFLYRQFKNEKDNNTKRNVKITTFVFIG